MKKSRIVSLVLLGAVALTSLSAGVSASGASSGDLLSQIKAKGVFTVGTEGTYPPFDYHDSSNNLVGFDVDVARAVGKQLGVKVVFVETKWDSLIAGIDAKRYDAVFDQVSITPERKQKYDFSTPYTITRAALIVRSDEKDIKKFSDLKNKKSAQSITSNYAKLAQQYGAQVVGDDGFDQSVALVLSKRADATINDDIAYYDYLHKKPTTKLKIAATLSDASKNAVLIPKGNASLLKAINTALSKLAKNGTLSKLSKKYFNKDVTK